MRRPKQPTHATIPWARRFALVHGAQALGALAEGDYRGAEAALLLAAKYARRAAAMKERSEEGGARAMPAPESKPLGVREAARQRMPLDGADAQALEVALAATERERDAALTRLDTIAETLGLVDQEGHGPRKVYNSKEIVQQIKAMVAEREDLLRRAGQLPGLSATLDEVTWERDLLLVVAAEARALLLDLHFTYVPFISTDELRAAVMAHDRRLQPSATVSSEEGDAKR